MYNLPHIYESELTKQPQNGSAAAPDIRLPNWPAGLSESLAARYIGVSRSLLRALQSTGKIARVRISPGRFIYRRADLDDFLAKLAGEDEHEGAREWEEV